MHAEYGIFRRDIKQVTAMNTPGSRTTFFYNYYSEKLSRHRSSSAEAVGWSEYLQERLFDCLVEIIDDHNHFSILDVGCGLGHLAGHLASLGYCTYDYTGIDIVEEMIQKAEILYRNHLFLKADFLKYSFFRNYDYTFCSGTLNIITDHHFFTQDEYITAFIARLYHLAKKGCAFNLLSSRSADLFPDTGNFYYADPVFIRKICSRICKNVTIDDNGHDYIFTVFMKRETTQAGDSSA